MSNSNTSNSPIPTTAQLADARLKQWHQQGEALLTIENLRSWINAAGLVLFAPRPQIASPAPSLVEGVLGIPEPSPTLEQTLQARSLLARLIAEGVAVPLNLLGTTGSAAETPDFVASAAVFSYVFTLRGDKAWKQPPATSGAIKVSNLALATHEALSKRGPLTAYDLTTELGKEVTEAAVLRALTELWTHLRVLPLPQPDGLPTIWELASARFTKQIKAGANAGQPSALSALISLYLGQAVVAAEDEIETFLSPLAPRSRIRDVIHALLSARQLDTVAIDGRTMLHVAGELPVFLAPEIAPSEMPQPVETEVAGDSGADSSELADATGEAQSRIKKYVPKPRKVGTGYLAKAKPAKFSPKPFSAERPAKSGPKEGFTPRPKPDFKSRPKPGFQTRPEGGSSDRERRPFSKPADPGGKRGYDKPWDEERARKPFTPRGDKEAGDARPPRKSFSKPGTFGRKREGFGGKPASGGQSRPPRREFSSGPPQDFKSSGAAGERGRKPTGESRGSYTPRPRGDRPQRSEGSSFASRKPYGSRPSGGAGFGGRPSFSKDRPANGPRSERDRGENTESGKRVYRKFDAPRGDRPARPFRSDRPARSEGAAGEPRRSAVDFAPRKFAGKPAGKPGGFAGKKPFGKSERGGSEGKPSSTFAKFAGNKKPFGGKPPARKFKPRKDGSA